MPRMLLQQQSQENQENGVGQGRQDDDGDDDDVSSSDEQQQDDMKRGGAQAAATDTDTATNTAATTETAAAPVVKRKRGRPPKNASAAAANAAAAPAAAAATGNGSGGRKKDCGGNGAPGDAGTSHAGELGTEESVDVRRGKARIDLLYPPPPPVPPARRRLLCQVGQFLEREHDTEVFERILQQGKELAAASRARFNSLVPDCLIGSSSPATPYITEPMVVGAQQQLERIFEAPVSASTVPVGVKTVLERELGKKVRTHVVAAIEYRCRYERWRKKELQRIQQQQAAKEAAMVAAEMCATTGNNSFRRSNSVMSRGGGGGGGGAFGGGGNGNTAGGSGGFGSILFGSGSLDPPNSPAIGRSSSRGGRADIVRSDLEERQAIATLNAIDLVKKMVELPPMAMLSPRAARWEAHYIDHNRLVTDPIADNYNTKFIRPWTESEISIFAEKFLAYHKDFQRIAPFLPDRTVPEVVRLYYAVQHTEEFEITRRKYQLRKRREKAEENAAAARMGGPLMLASLPVPKLGEEQGGGGGGGGGTSGRYGNDRLGRTGSRSSGFGDSEGEFGNASGGRERDRERGATATTATGAGSGSTGGVAGGGTSGRGRGRGRGGGRGRGRGRAAGVAASQQLLLQQQQQQQYLLSLEPVYPDLPTWSWSWVGDGERRPLRSSRIRATSLAHILEHEFYTTTELFTASSPFYEEYNAAVAPPPPPPPVIAVAAPTTAGPLQTITTSRRGRSAGIYALSDDDDGAMAVDSDNESDYVGAGGGGGGGGRRSNAVRSTSTTHVAARGAGAADGRPNVGRGRLPAPTTDAKFIQGVKLYGRDWSLLAAHMGNRNAASVRLYWERHRERLGLDALANGGDVGDAGDVGGVGSGRSGGGDRGGRPSNVVGETTLHILNIANVWKPIIDALKKNDDDGGDDDSGVVFDVLSKLVDAVDTPGIDIEASQDADADATMISSQTRLLLRSKLTQEECQRCVHLIKNQVIRVDGDNGSIVEVLEDDNPCDALIAASIARPSLVRSFLLAIDQYAYSSLHSATTAPAFSELHLTTTAAAGVTKQQHPSPNAGKPNAQPTGNGGRRGKASLWSEEERAALIQVYATYGRNFDLMYGAVPTKTPTQIRNFYQNYRAKVFDPIPLPVGAALPQGRRKRAAAAAGGGGNVLEIGAGNVNVNADMIATAAGAGGGKRKKRGRPPSAAVAAAALAMQQQQREQQQQQSLGIQTGEHQQSDAAAGAALMQQQALLLQLMGASSTAVPTASTTTAATAAAAAAAPLQAQQILAALGITPGLAPTAAAAVVEEQAGKMLSLIQNTSAMTMVQLNAMLLVQMQAQAQALMNGQQQQQTVATAVTLAGAPQQQDQQQQQQQVLPAVAHVTNILQQQANELTVALQNVLGDAGLLPPPPASTATVDADAPNVEEVGKVAGGEEGGLGGVEAVNATATEDEDVDVGGGAAVLAPAALDDGGDAGAGDSGGEHGKGDRMEVEGEADGVAEPMQIDTQNDSDKDDSGRQQ